MKKAFMTAVLVLLLTTGCVTTTGGTQYGGQVTPPNMRQQSDQRTSSGVPLPTETTAKRELSYKELTKAYNTTFQDLFTHSLKALRNLNFTISTFNSTDGVIEFKSYNLKPMYLKVLSDKECPTASYARILSKDGSRKINPNLVENIFKEIDSLAN